MTPASDRKTLFVAYAHEFTDAYIGVFSTIEKARVAVDAWYAKKAKGTGNTITWHLFVDQAGRPLANGRECVRGHAFGPNCFFLRPCVMDEERGEIEWRM